MNDYISGNSITDKISNLQFFPLNYFNTYIKNFTSKNNLIYENINTLVDQYINSSMILICKHIDISI